MFEPTKLQVEPADYDMWLMVADRGAGATRAGAETVARWVRENPGIQVLVLAPVHQLRWCFEGPAGLLDRFENEEIQRFSTPGLILELQNGSRIRGEVAGAARGLEADRAWVSDLHNWRHQDDLSQVSFVLRNNRSHKIVGNTVRDGMPQWVLDLVVQAHDPATGLVVTTS